MKVHHKKHNPSPNHIVTQIVTLIVKGCTALQKSNDIKLGTKYKSIIASFFTDWSLYQSCFFCANNYIIAKNYSSALCANNYVVTKKNIKRATKRQIFQITKGYSRDFE